MLLKINFYVRVGDLPTAIYFFLMLNFNRTIHKNIAQPILDILANPRTNSYGSAYTVEREQSFSNFHGIL